MSLKTSYLKYMEKEADWGLSSWLGIDEKIDKKIKKGTEDAFKAVPGEINTILTKYFRDQMKTPAAYGLAGVYGLAGGAALGSQLGSAYAEDRKKSKFKGMLTGGAIGGTVGTTAGLAALLLANKYKLI